MYKNLSNICYECGATLDKESLTKEHVPPKSFFPKSDRDSLITVPACVKHNGGKSDNDEYFFQIICMQIQANEKGQDIATNKAVRGVLRNRKITKDLASNATQVYIDEDRTGQLKPTFAFKFDDEKLDNSISSICKALYYYEFNKVFIGDIKTYYEFQISLDEDSIKQNQEFEKIRHLINKNFSNIEKKGK
ncbi:HNH endonuclease, partial [Psychrobacter namhaensis]|uniref:HNH endonuclease n=1 Tax=Psychrobacter namhaensis TaxID=292734 RepID=UPI003FD2EAB1